MKRVFTLSVISALILGGCAPPCTTTQCELDRQNAMLAALAGLEVMQIGQEQRQAEVYEQPELQPFHYGAGAPPPENPFPMRRADPITPPQMPQWPYGKGWLIDPASQD